MGYQKFSERGDHLTLGALGGLGGQHRQNSNGQAKGGEAQILILTPPKAPKPPKVLASIPANFAYAEALDQLERECPEYVAAERWRQCLIDAQRFLAAWGDKAEAFGWNSEDLFGLHSPSAKPHSTYSRLSRYDCTGLLWLLQGRRVIALAATTAAIENSGGTTLTYRIPYRQ